MAKKRKPAFCEPGYDNSDLRVGRSITVSRSWIYRGENADFKPFLNIPLKELERRLKDSQAEEKKVYDHLQKEAKAWDEHGAQTLLLQKALEYLRTPEIKHTNNEWTKQENGSWEISNMVYKMTFSIVKFGDEWKLSWEIQYTAPGKQQEHYHSYYNTGPKKRIDHEGSKKYKTLDGAQKYMQMKFDQYSSYFSTISPPIPLEAKELFCVNGQLLQGYTMARPEEKKKEVTLSELLACLEDGDNLEEKPSDTSVTSPAPPPTEQAPSSKGDTKQEKETRPKPKSSSRSATEKKPHHKKKTAPTR